MLQFCAFQRQQTLGNKIEAEITKLIEENPTILRLGLHLEYNDARNRVATHLQRNLDRSKSRFSLQHVFFRQIFIFMYSKENPFKTV